LQEYALISGAFTRNRKLPLEHTLGIVLHMSAHRNMDGYDITSQNYFAELSRFTGDAINPVSHQAISQARAKIDWEAFRYLLQQANQDEVFSGKAFRYRGHIVRAIDGTQITLPRSEDILDLFEPHNTRTGVSHYPAALLVTAMNVFTGQCKAARVVNHVGSEREQLMSMVELDFASGDIAVLDRGFHGDSVFLRFEDHRQFYLCRMRSAEERRDAKIHEFLTSGKKEQVFSVEVIRATGEVAQIKIRLLLGPKDSEGKHVVLATNLLNPQHYSRKSLLALYSTRWRVETMYGRVKTLLQLEQFHARTYNGVMQEIFANLLLISLTALVLLAAAKKLKLDPDIAVPSFKNALTVIKRHLAELIRVREPITPERAKNLAEAIIEEASRLIWKKQPGRSYPRISHRPAKGWSLYKNDRIKEFKKLTRQRALNCQH